MISSFKQQLSRSVFLLVLAPMLFMGANCATDPQPSGSLKLNSLRAEVTKEGTFASDFVEAHELGNAWEVQADMSVGSNTLVITARVPKQTPPPYTVQINPTTTALLGYCIEKSGACIQYTASNSKGSGSITVSEIDAVARTVKGTFSGRLVANTADSLRTISGGEFYFSY